MFVELDAREDQHHVVALEWDRETGETRIVVDDLDTESQIRFFVSGEDAGDAFRHPFRYVG
jgi:hypothetical protein